MKRILTRTVCLLLLAALLTGSAFAAGLRPLRHTALPLADSLQLETAFLDGSGSAAEHRLTYTPGGDVMPIVVYGNTLYGRSTMDYIAAYLQRQNLIPVAAVNASFFDMSTGIPYGFVVTDGVLRSGGNTPSIGIAADGSMHIGTPQLTVTMTSGSGTADLAYNKALSKTNGFCLYSRDYDSSTKHTLPAWNVILQSDTPQLPLHGSVEAVITDVVPDTASCPIPEDGFVLSLATETAYTSALESMLQFRIGDRITISTMLDDPWHDMVYAVGGGDMLVEDGQACAVFTHSTANQRAPRTALGVTAAGQAVLYTVDRSSRSDGMTLQELAQRMRELGCRTAINLDGGGSTCLGVTFPGTQAFSTVNEPSGGSQRPCANYLFFVRPAAAADQAARLHLYPYDAVVLPGGSVEMSVAATDQNWQAASVPENLTLSAVGGTMSGSTFTADSVGTAVISAAAGNLRGAAPLLVTDTPSSISITRPDRAEALSSLQILSGTTIRLEASARYLGSPVAASNRSFQWQLSDDVGTVTEDGVFTAAVHPSEGTLHIQCGQTTLTIPVKVFANPFSDTDGHWAADPIAQLYLSGTLTGSADSSGRLLYRPNDSMTRQEFLTALMRFSGTDPQAYRDQVLPFADTASIADWAMDAVKAAYAQNLFTGTQKGSQLLADPNRTISREQAMTILARFLNVSEDPSLLQTFSDAELVSDWAAPYLAAMVQKNIVTGTDGKLLPTQRVTRAQMAKMLFSMS